MDKEWSEIISNPRGRGMDLSVTIVYTSRPRISELCRAVCAQ